MAAPRARNYRPGPPDDVMFPVTPMLDMAFQLLAFFILTFKVPIGRDPPGSGPARDAGRLARGGRRQSPAPAGSDRRLRPGKRPVGPRRGRRPGRLENLRLGEAPVPDLATLGNRLRRYTQLLDGRPLRVRLVADDQLRYEPAAQIIATCSAAGVAAIRLTQPGATPALPDHR